jgi:hypothetical protein
VDNLLGLIAGRRPVVLAAVERLHAGATDLAVGSPPSSYRGHARQHQRLVGPMAETFHPGWADAAPSGAKRGRWSRICYRRKNQRTSGMVVSWSARDTSTTQHTCKCRKVAPLAMPAVVSRSFIWQIGSALEIVIDWIRAER